MKVFSDIIQKASSPEDVEMHESEENRIRAEKESKLKKILERVE